MEEILVLVFQAVIEVAAELLFYLGLGWPWPSNTEGRGGYWFLGVVVFLVLGGILGAVVTAFSPHLLIPYPWLRIANLLLAPAASAVIAWQWARWRQRRDPGVAPGQHALFAALFTLAFAVVRFAYATH